MLKNPNGRRLATIFFVFFVLGIFIENVKYKTHLRHIKRPNNSLLTTQEMIDWLNVEILGDFFGNLSQGFFGDFSQ
jgi:hypothetical protein